MSARLKELEMDLSGYTLAELHQDGDFVLCRGRADATAVREHSTVLVTMPWSENPAPDRIRMLEQEWAFRSDLESTWAVRPVALGEYRGRAALILEDPEGEPLARLLHASRDSRTPNTGPSADRAIELGQFLRLAIGLAAALGEMHRRGIVHRNIKPAHVFVNAVTNQVWLTGFGIASRLQRERQAPTPPETIAGTLAYMAPEQTGRMNRSIDARSDLYAVGVTLYEMLTGSLPFTAADPMEWVHCHIARQPRPPGEQFSTVPPSVSAIIMKLLAKTAEERYQTAAGLEHDLRHCLSEWEADQRIQDFAIGQHDTPDRLLIPERLYGRAGEIESLLAAFDRVVHGGAPELVLVTGYSGIGKSSLVNELHKVLVPPRGQFASGKFEQLKRDIPYATLAQALQSLVRPLLTKNEEELSRWRNALRDALGPNGQLMVELVPDLKAIVGEQPAVPTLPPQDAQRRFQLVFRRLLGVFARPEHPLALFLDDLQWLDIATLDLLQELMIQTDVRHLLLIGAYRDNEVTNAHPLVRRLGEIRRTGAPMQEIVLAPLGDHDLCRLVADALYCETSRAASLARLVREKTDGNPFFAIQFLLTLVEEGLLTFESRQSRWCWDLSAIDGKGYTDNVVDLMVAKLHRLPVEAQGALRQLACVGNSADSAVLGTICGESTDVEGDLQNAVHAGLILSSQGVYRFLHDRVQEAAYSLIPEARRAEVHLRIGRLLAARVPAERRGDTIFEVVNQLNRGVALIGSRQEREQLAEFNLIAGERAKASTAYVSALHYLAAGAALLSDDPWERRPELKFALELHRAECEFLTGALVDAEERLTMLSAHAANPVEQAAVTSMCIDLYTTLDRSDRAVDVCLAYLRHQGVEWSPHPTEEEARTEYARTWALLGRREIEDLIDLPFMSEPTVVAALDVLTKVLTPAMFTDANLHSLLVCRMVNLSLEYGNTDASCYAYVWLGMIAGPRFGNYEAGFRFGRLGLDLVGRPGFDRFQARTHLCFAVFIVPWTRHLRTGHDLIRRAFDAANTVGDLTMAAYSCDNLVGSLLATGERLVDVQREAERGLEFARQAHFGLVLDVITTQLGLIRTLRGLTPTFGCFNDVQFDEPVFERHLSSDPALAIAECWYWIRKLQARFLAGDYRSAVDASLNAQRLLWTSPSFIETAEAHFYGALSHAACCDEMQPDEYERHVEALALHHRQLTEWAAHCPENFENRALLIAAEIARLERRELDAERLYEAAIKSARDNGFVHNEALAAELAARFYSARGFETIALAYVHSARYGYLRWGADGKVLDLDQRYPHLRTEPAAGSPTDTIKEPVEHLDLATVLAVSQSVSGEVVLERLLDTLMRSAIEYAGAERAVLILSQDAELRVVAEATTGTANVFVRLCDESITGVIVPETVLRYVLHTRESVILDDAVTPSPFAADPYIRHRQARSLLVLPLTHQAKLIGVLYLENNLAPRVFSPGRTAVLKLFASQAAISLENSRLYGHLAKREARIRRLVDANIIGIFFWELGGRILEANDAFLKMVGYERVDLEGGALRWTDLTPPEWRAGDEQLMGELTSSGTLQPFEKEYFRKDGTRVSVLIGVAAFDERDNTGVAFVVDLTDRKRAEEALNRARAELAHVSRVTALSGLTASIAHEVSQPLAGITTNAGTCLRMLDVDPPDIHGARDTARRTIRDANRAADVIARLRALFSKREFTPESLDVNEVVREILALSSSELHRHGIALETELVDDLPTLKGDRVQLQQVVMNLIRNASEAMADVYDRERQLRITTEHEGNYVRVSVRDTGMGVSLEGREALFDPFYTTKAGGMGIGLFVSRSIVEKHGGRLWAEANQSGPGATFSFSIPDAAENPLSGAGGVQRP